MLLGSSNFLAHGFFLGLGEVILFLLPGALTGELGEGEMPFAFDLVITPTVRGTVA